MDSPPLQRHLDSMARWSGGPVTHRALKGPMVLPGSPQWKHELLYVLKCVRDIREKCDHTELATVRNARKAELSWTEIGEAVGVTRQAAWERWHELDETLTRD